MASPLAPKPIPGVTDKPIVSNPVLDVVGAPGKVLLESSNQVADNTTNAVTNVNDFLSKLSNVYLWKRIGIVAVGVLLVWWGILIFISTNKKIQGAVTATAKKVISGTPQGAAANIATGAVGL